MRHEMSEGAKALYNRIKDIEIFDPYACPDIVKFKRIYVNPWEAVESSSKREWLRLAGKDAESASDFECLSAYFECLECMPQNMEKEIFEEESRALLGDSAEEYDALNFWKTSCERLKDRKTDFVGFCSTFGVKKLVLPIFYDGVANIPAKRIFDPVCCLGNKAWLEKAASLAQLEENILDSLKKTEPPYLLRADISNIDFVRGDHYHCGEYFLRLRNGESLGKDEYSALVFFLLWDTAAKLGNDCDIYLNIGTNISAVRGFANYLSLRKMNPRVHIAVTPKTAGLEYELRDICLDFSNLSLDIVLGVGDSPERLRRRLEDILSVYPAKKLRFGGVMSDSVMFFAAHIYGRKAIASALWEIYGEERAACLVADSLFNSDNIK